MKNILNYLNAAKIILLAIIATFTSIGPLPPSEHMTKVPTLYLRELEKQNAGNHDYGDSRQGYLAIPPK